MNNSSLSGNVHPVQSVKSSKHVTIEETKKLNLNDYKNMLRRGSTFLLIFSRSLALSWIFCKQFYQHQDAERKSLLNSSLGPQTFSIVN